MSIYHKILKDHWGHEDFRPLQLEIIKSISEGKDTLALLPTGGGKSICFQVPAMAKSGICVVVSPLIALMKDQTFQLKKKNIPALSLYSGMSWKEIDITLDRCVYEDVKFLYVSPERLKTEIFRERLKKMSLNLIAVDEAHCISQWGYDFRPSYLQIAELRALTPGIPIIALTATATATVIADIQEKLLFTKKNVFSKSFVRPNLSYSCFSIEDKDAKLLQILKNVPGTAIVYVRSRKLTSKLSEKLNKYNIHAGAYHAGLSYQERETIQNKWIDGSLRVIVATNAFGMGIDKPNVRSVIHMDIPDNLEAYYQEAGRAGRDGKKAYAVLLFHHGDILLSKQRLEDAHPEISMLKRVYQCLANFYKLAEGSNAFASFDLDIDIFCKTFALEKSKVLICLKVLERENLVQFNESFYDPSKIFFILKDLRLYEYQIAHAEHDELIKLILRMYGGELFSGFVMVSENRLSQALNTAEKEIEKKLNALVTNGVLIYAKKKNQPQITFLTPRLDAAALPVNTALLEKRKRFLADKNEAMINYTLQNLICRTASLVTYFGETGILDCGVCDICIAKRKDKIHVDDLTIETYILKSLTFSNLTINELILSNSQNEKNILRIVRYLIDSQKLELNSAGILKIKDAKSSL